ncbi:MAG: DUF962 domain-containing protein [Burkholderiales bacterium]|nr:DUF962 domain-containing protein [Burkholderiales bacterium]MDE2287572.1 DUF962 domain-containing protein [Burkholderiales bacterium]MDE2610161.1 DUF962 domain-containing protein [Burkholderiales bacterium]
MSDVRTDHFRTFAEFYPYYLSEHRNRTCRRLHFAGSLGALALLAVFAITGSPWWLLGVPLCGYAFAWVGHFFFEKNRPATFRHPWYSLIGDWAMFRDICRGRIRL